MLSACWWRWPTDLGRAWTSRTLEGDLLARGTLAVEDSVVVDGPTVFLWGVLLVMSLISVLLFAERRLEGGLTGFAGQAAALPGTEAEREASTQGVEHTEVFPLMLFAVVGACCCSPRPTTC